MTHRLLLCPAMLLLSAGLFFGCTASENGVSKSDLPEPSIVDFIPAEQEGAASEQAPAATSEPDYTVLRDEAACSVLFISAGKADAALVQTGEKSILIDTGEDTSVPAILGALKLMETDRLDAVFLTHTHSDHMGGFKALASVLPIDRVYRAAISEDKKDGSNKIDNAAEKAGIPVTKLEAGNTIDLADGVMIEVLGPRVYNAEDDNDNSLVLRLTAVGVRMLFTGDMQFAEEMSLIGAGVDLAADVLKVGNHGNPDATGDGFARLVNPRWAIIPTDRAVDADSANPRVIAALDDAEIYITDEFQTGVLVSVSEDGTVRFADPHCAATLQIVIEHLDRSKQQIVLRNEGDSAADLSDCIMYSGRGSEVFCIPEGTILSSGQTLTISGEEGGGDLEWTGEKKPWNTKKDDSAFFYDSYGNLLSRFD